MERLVEIINSVNLLVHNSVYYLNGNDFIHDTHLGVTLIDHFKNIDSLTNLHVLSYLVCLAIGTTFPISKCFSRLTTTMHVIIFKNFVHSGLFIFSLEDPDKLVRGIREKSKIVASVSSQGLNPSLTK